MLTVTQSLVRFLRYEVLEQVGTKQCDHTLSRDGTSYELVADLARSFFMTTPVYMEPTCCASTNEGRYVYEQFAVKYYCGLQNSDALNITIFNQHPTFSLQIFLI